MGTRVCQTHLQRHSRGNEQRPRALVINFLSLMPQHSRPWPSRRDSRLYAHTHSHALSTFCLILSRIKSMTIHLAFHIVLLKICNSLKKNLQKTDVYLMT